MLDIYLQCKSYHKKIIIYMCVIIYKLIMSKQIDELTDDEIMKINYAYPDPSDPDLQYKLFKKREFYYYKLPQRPDINNWEDVKDYRDKTCAKKISLREHQIMLSNFINPNTPYKGILIFHGLGT